MVPAFLNPFKSDSFLNSQARFDLVKKLFLDEPKVVVSDYEIKQHEPVYSIETVKYLKQLYKASKIYLLIGADNLEKLHLWHSYKELSDLVEFVVVDRKDYTSDYASHITHHLSLRIDISSTSLRNKLNLEYIPKKIQNEVKKIWNKE